MPKTRSKNLLASVTRQVSYKDSDSTDEHDEPGLLTNILGLLMNMQQRSAQKKNKRKAPRKASKRKQSLGCDCPHCTPKRSCAGRRSQTKGKPNNQSSTATKTSLALNLDSDDEEIAGASITESQVDTIKNKVDTFFKALDSEEDELELKLKSKPLCPPKLVEKKSKDFYTILSDSEDDREKPSTSANTTSSFPEPGTSGQSNCINTGQTNFSQTRNKVSEKNSEDLFAYVDDILNDCNIVDITSDQHKENVPVVSLEDLKKKTDEILGGVTSLIDDLKPKPAEPVKTPEYPIKDAPACPICLETLGGSRQTMATLCGHMFCGPCIAQVAKTSKKCPTCRKGITKTKYHPVYI